MDGSDEERLARRGLTRRTFVSVGTGALLMAVTPGFLWPRARGRVHRRSLPVMGTLAEIVVVESDVARARASIDAAFTELRTVDRAMSRFDPASDVGRVNAARSGARVAVSAETAAVVAAGLSWAEATGGRFDPGLARAVALWDVGRRDVPPPEEAVRRYAGRDLHRELVVERGSGAAIVRRHPDVAVDLGGIAKGHAVDRAVRALREHGIRDAMVSAGGDLYAMGRSPEGDPWRVGIRSPDDPTRLADEIEVEDRAVATSGDYESFFEHGGRRYHHLLDPSTGAPRVTSARSLTVTADRCLDADAAATACFGLSGADAAARLRSVAPDVAVV